MPFLSFISIRYKTNETKYLQIETKVFSKCIVSPGVNFDGLKIKSKNYFIYDIFFGRSDRLIQSNVSFIIIIYNQFKITYLQYKYLSDRIPYPGYTAHL